MQLTNDKIIEIFYLIGEFCKEFQETISVHTIGNKPKRKPKNDPQ